MLPKVKILTLSILALTVLIFSRAQGEEASFLEEGGLAISPFLTEIEVKPGQTHTYTIEVFNTSKQDQKLQYSLQDFVPEGRSGNVRFLPTNQTDTSEYSLLNWIEITKQPDFFIKSGDKTSIELKITPPADTPHGSKYGGVLFGFENPEKNLGDIKVSKKIGSLLVVRYGQGRTAGQITVDFPKINLSKNLSGTLTFKNTGKTHTTPKGESYFYNWRGKLVTTITSNQNGQLVLPETEREFVFSKDKWLFGRYKMETVVFYGSDPKLEARESRIIWIFPIKEIGQNLPPILGGLILLYLGYKQYNQWIIRKNAQ